MEPDSSPDLTELLNRTEQDLGPAMAALLPLVYGELRGLARACFARSAGPQTMEPTALVHEVWLKLERNHGTACRDRAHFFAIAARAMRQVLADHARKRKALKRGGDLERVTLTGIGTDSESERMVDLAALHEALERLTALSERQARIVELRFLGGLEETEVAELLDVTVRTVQRDWRVAKAFLRAELDG